MKYLNIKWVQHLLNKMKHLFSNYDVADIILSEEWLQRVQQKHYAKDNYNLSGEIRTYQPIIYKWNIIISVT